MNTAKEHYDIFHIYNGIFILELTTKLIDHITVFTGFLNRKLIVLLDVNIEQSLIRTLASFTSEQFHSQRNTVVPLLWHHPDVACIFYWWVEHVNNCSSTIHVAIESLI